MDIIRAKHNTCLNNTNLGSVTGVKGKNTNLGSVTAVNGKNPAPPLNMDPGKCLLLPPPTESIRATLGLPPQMDVGPYAYAYNCNLDLIQCKEIPGIPAVKYGGVTSGCVEATS